MRENRLSGWEGGGAANPALPTPIARYAPLPRSDRSSLLLQVQPPTGEPDAGDPPSGSEGGGVANPTLPTPIQSASQQFFGSLLGGASHRL